jgi:hypothetical protein
LIDFEALRGASAVEDEKVHEPIYTTCKVIQGS